MPTVPLLPGQNVLRATPSLGKTYALDTAVGCMSYVPCTRGWFELNVTLRICTTTEKNGTQKHMLPLLQLEEDTFQEGRWLCRATPPSYVPFLLSSFPILSLFLLPSDPAQD